MPTTAAWKRSERTVARRLGGQRSSNTGKATEDVNHARLSSEVKRRASLPAWLTDAVRHATTNAPAGRLPTVVLHQASTARYLVVLDLVQLQVLLAECESRKEAA